jgi:GNAT superfamily N-acetyltransferase
MMTYNPPYYQKLVEENGLKKAKDLYAWYLDIRNYQIPERLVNIAQKSMERYNITLRNLKLKDLNKELKLVLEVYNNAWSKNWGFVPMTTEEILHAADDLKQIADEEFILLAERDGKPVGFSLTLPNINEIVINIRNGKLLPTGLFKLLTGMKKIRNVRVIMLGVVRDLQKAGLGAIFYVETLRRAMERGLDGGEMSWILEDNYPMNSAIEMFGSQCYKTYRIYHDRL